MQNTAMARSPSWLRRHDGWLIGIALALCLLGVGGYQIIAARDNSATQSRIDRNVTTCAQVESFYRVVAKLAADDPRFSPAELRAFDAQRRARLALQDCK